MFYIKILITSLLLFHKYDVMSSTATFIFLIAIFLAFYILNCIQEPFITKKIESLYENSLLLIILTLGCYLWKDKDFYIYDTIKIIDIFMILNIFFILFRIYSIHLKNRKLTKLRMKK